jgi:peptidoglycan/xylan/chitin deacetylase (PgdA/CDA1 family)
MYLTKTPTLISKLHRPDALWKIPTTEDIIYLTFDDGPIPEVTPFVLDELEKVGAKATFFCIGDNIRKHPDIFQEIIKRGHLIGNHTHNHLNGWKSSPKSYITNVVKCNSMYKTNLFRPPYGRLSLVQYRALRKHFRVVFWTVLSGDFDKKLSPEQCLSNCIQYTEKGSIVVFHDSLKAFKNLEYTLPRFLQHFKEKKFRFETIPNS